MEYSRGCALALLLTAFVGAAGRPAPDGPPAFALAMLRRDGVLVPFAVNDGKKWSSPWPVPKYRLEAPLAFADIPEDWWGRAARATTWTAWPTRGEPRTVHVTGPVVFTTHCLSNIGLKTDYRSSEPVPPVTQQHHPKDGVATTGNETIEAVEVLDDAAPEWSATLEILKSAIESQESKTPSTDWYQQAFQWRDRRAKTPLKLEVLCRSKAAAPRAVVYYFEVAREYPPMPDKFFGIASDWGGRGCGLTIFTQGFFVLDGKNLAFQNIASTFTNCNRTDVDYGLPLGIIRVNARDHWIMHWSGFGRERYTILEVGEKSFKRVVDVPGGAC